MVKQDVLYVVAPAYNEEDNVEKFVQDWYPVIEERSEQSRIVLLNDGSSDNTGEIAKSLADEHPKLTVISRSNRGHGPSCVELYNYAIEQGADWVLQVDSDNQVLSEDFDKFWNRRHEAPFILGNRVNRGDGWYHSLASMTLRGVLFAITGNNLKDANVPYRLMRADRLHNLIDKVEEDFFLANALLTAVAVEEDTEVLFVPIQFVPREHGESLYSMFSLLRKGCRATYFFIRYFWLSHLSGHSHTNDT